MAASSPRLYYSTDGPMTDPGAHARLLDGLPRDVAGIVSVVQGLLVHVFWAERYGLKLTPERQAEVQIRPLGPKLDRLLGLDPSPLTQARPLERRLVGNCRDFSLLLTALLRRQGYSARARCGFGTYFLPDHYEDHWVGEYWNADEGRWVMVDAQLDAYQREVLGIRFDPLDVPADGFVVAGRAWQLARSGALDPDTCGIFDMHGLGFIRGNVVCDFLALNKVEILPWDHGFGILGDDAPANADEDGRLIDRIAALTLAGDSGFDELRDAHESDRRFHVPADWLG